MFPYDDPRYRDCPAEIRSSLAAYAEAGLMPGGFLQAVLANDLMDAVARADSFNIEMLPVIATYVREHMPPASWGSRAAVDEWVRRRVPAMQAESHAEDTHDPGASDTGGGTGD
jgi:hypothetical protein